MAATPFEGNPLQDPEGRLETALIEEYLVARGYSLAALASLPADQANRLRRAAAVYAASKLAEVESRSRFVHEIHSED